MGPLAVHHIALSTSNLENTIGWYGDYFGCVVKWEMDKDEFSDLTRRRIPSITRMVELEVDDLRFHVIEHRDGPRRDPTVLPPVHHIGLSVGSVEELVERRARWLELFSSGVYSFAISEPPTEIVCDPSSKIHSLYVYDVNGVELEFSTCPPAL